MDLALDLVSPTIAPSLRNGDRGVIDRYNIDRRPPCWEAGKPCPNPCAKDHYRRVIDNHVELHGDWASRVTGRE